MAKVSVIVPAAGSGKRFGGKANKIFQRIAGQPVFLRTLEAFTGRDDVVQTLLVVSAADEEEIRTRFGGALGFMGVTVVTGGATRADSVRNALARVSDEAELVAVHDAVRPCVSALWIDAVFAEAGKTGAAILAYPLHGTLKKVSGAGMIDQTLPREGLWEAQTPQVFRRELLVRAYAGPVTDATDDAQLVERLGHPVSVVTGDPRNVKITTPGDLRLAESVLGTLPKPKPKDDGMGPFHEARW
ncbi:MAG TPA: 2-C-methyl-D-erythritol 4-phosphate cytidylyltransferase [Phycisphaerales bacterium]|nr:2-C-methyl-D-erythritol 4-phosphate cytidylyltransferase [Phycisphaerales bacterium]